MYMHMIINIILNISVLIFKNMMIAIVFVDVSYMNDKHIIYTKFITNPMKRYMEWHYPRSIDNYLFQMRHVLVSILYI